MTDPVPSKDLLTRLRTGYLCETEGCRCHAIEARYGCQCAEAADEIERLQQELSKSAHEREATIYHYKQRIRMLLPYVCHKADCAYTQWQMRYQHKLAKLTPARCSCGAAALVAIAQAEVYDEHGNPV